MPSEACIMTGVPAAQDIVQQPMAGAYMTWSATLDNDLD